MSQLDHASVSPATAAPDLRKRALTSVAALALIASGAIGTTIIESRAPAFAEQGPIVANAQAPASFADLVDKVKPAVVSVKVTVENAAGDDEGLSLDNVPPQLRDFF